MTATIHWLRADHDPSSATTAHHDAQAGDELSADAQAGDEFSADAQAGDEFSADAQAGDDFSAEALIADEFDLDLPVEVDQRRIALARALNQSLTTLDDARAALGALTGGHVHDIEYVAGPDGSDVAAFIDDALRSIRAAYAIAYRIAY